MRLKYVGPKKRHTFNFPIPYISKGESEGEVAFNKDEEKDIKDVWANRLLEFCPQFFVKPGQPQPQKG